VIIQLIFKNNYGGLGDSRQVCNRSTVLGKTKACYESWFIGLD